MSVDRLPGRQPGSGGRTVLGAGLALACLAATAAAVAKGPPIKPYKDELFQNHVVRTLYDGDMRFIEYSKQRDLYGRDKVVEKKAYDKFVSLEPDKVQQDLVLHDGGKIVRYVGVGRTEGDARFIVFFLHGGTRQPLPGGRRLVVRRQLQPAEESRRPQRRRLPVARLRPLRRRGRHQGADEGLCANARPARR